MNSILMLLLVSILAIPSSADSDSKNKPVEGKAAKKIKFHTGPVTCGISSWMSHYPGRDALNAYNKLAFDSYFSYGKLKGFVGIPLQCTVEKRDSLNVNGRKIPYDTVFSAFALGDFTTYVGYKIGNIEPRIGVTFPLFYKTNTGVWLGSKNVVLKTGFGFSGDLYKKLRLRYGGEIYYNLYVAGYPEIDGSLGKRGSWYIDPDIKVTSKVTKKLTVGLETLCGFKKLYPSWLKYGSFQGYELSSSIVPHAIFSYEFSWKYYISGKAGFGAGFKRKVDSSQGEHPWRHTGYASNFGISVGFYP